MPPPASPRIFGTRVIDGGDLAYYVKIVTVKVAEMAPRMVEELKGKAN